MDFQHWKALHRQQLEAIPELYWETLFKKLCTETFDAGEYFIMTPSSLGWTVRVKNRQGLPIDSNNVFLVDHAWTYLPEKCHEQLSTIPGLAIRMANLMDLLERPATPPQLDNDDNDDDPHPQNELEMNGIRGNGQNEEVEEEEEEDNDEVQINETLQTSMEEEEDDSSMLLPSEDLIEKIMENMWRFNDWYSVSNVPVPIWYILEEFGARIHQSDNPTVAMVPFFHILSQMSYSILWPLQNLEYGDVLTRNRIPVSVESRLGRACHCIPWSSPETLPLSDPLWAELASLPAPPMPERCQEQLPDMPTSIPPIVSLPYKVYSEVDPVRKHLTHPQFKLVYSQDNADILWFFDHLKNYRSVRPSQLINQFPSENVLTCKDLLISVARRATKGHSHNPTHSPEWLPESYNLFYELPRFVHEFKTREKEEQDNIWIIKPWNLGRGMDTYITKNLPQIVRLSQASPKIACKYITNPVLFHREDVGNVKMDVRYIVLLVSVQPLVVYAYNTFWLRFANKPFSLQSPLYDYETHFTVMNYREESQLKHIESVEFIPLFEEQNPLYPWKGIEEDIFQAFYELFSVATSEAPPAGIAHFPQSRAMYAIDLMLEWASPDGGCGCQHIQPKILEVNFCPDINRACQHHPNFINNVFECLFLPESQHSPDLPVTRLKEK